MKDIREYEAAKAAWGSKIETTDSKMKSSSTDSSGGVTASRAAVHSRIGLKK
jgi:hypothetical protein